MAFDTVVDEEELSKVMSLADDHRDQEDVHKIKDIQSILASTISLPGNPLAGNSVPNEAKHSNHSNSSVSDSESDSDSDSSSNKSEGDEEKKDGETEEQKEEIKTAPAANAPHESDDEEDEATLKKKA